MDVGAPTTRRSYLLVVTSSNQLYSGTGTALFDWVRYAKRHYDFSLMMDNLDARNHRVGYEFCRDAGIGFIHAGAAPKAGAPDNGVANVHHVLRARPWSVVEIVSWANAATNLDVLTAREAGTTLVFTPHTQPIWTLSDHERYFLVGPTLRRAVAEADLVCCDSLQEKADLERSVPGASLAYVPLGANEAEFRLGAAPKRREVLTVCDFREPRKRADLAFAAMARLRERDAGVGYTIAGRHSDRIAAPASLDGTARRLGYVSHARLVESYQTATTFLLLSDYEAFGLPIVEALFCGTSVVASDTREIRSLFDGLPGVHLVRNTEAPAVDRALDRALNEAVPPGAIRDAAVRAFGLDATYGRKLELLSHLARVGDPARRPRASVA